MNHKKAIAIDIGATNTRVALIDNLGQLVYKNQTKTIHTESNHEFINFLREFIDDSFEKKDILDACGFGISIAGFIDADKGILSKSPNLPNKNLAIAKSLDQYYQKPIVLNNDTNAAILGEKLWGHGKNETNFAFITFSTGIGGSAYVDNKLVTDDIGNSLEIGHITIESDYNQLCGCGGKNHWESFTSGINLPKFLKSWAKKSKINLRFDGSSVFRIFDAIDIENNQARKFFTEVMKINIIGINHLIEEYSPGLIILGGSVYLHHQKLFNKYLPTEPVFKSAFFGDNDSLVGSVSPIFSSK